jgi:hypothetical protein
MTIVIGIMAPTIGRYMTRHYCIREGENGYDPCDILLDHGLGNSDFRTYVIREEDLKPWQICSALNSAYEAGREDAMRDLRNFIGVGK